MLTKYDIIYADPPWDYKGQKQHKGKGKGNSGGAMGHFSTLKLPHLKTLPVDEISSDNSLLFMWITSPHLDQGIDLLKSWGFEWATVAFVWNKVRVNPGFYTMSQCELCVVGKKGKIPNPRGARNVRQYIEEMRGSHSAKPMEVRERIEEMFPAQTKLELFARGGKLGWTSWGREAICHDNDLQQHFEDYGWPT